MNRIFKIMLSAFALSIAAMSVAKANEPNPIIVDFNRPAPVANEPTPIIVDFFGTPMCVSPVDGHVYGPPVNGSCDAYVPQDG